MATYSRPGVFISEVALPQSIESANNSASRGAFVGKFAKGPTTSPVLVTSWYEFVKTFGGLSDSFPATWGLYTFFANGGRQVYVKRVVSTGAASATVTLLDHAGSPASTLQLVAANPGSWANTLKAEVKAASATTFNLIISDSSGVLEQHTDLSMSESSSRYVVSYVNSSSSYVSVTDLGSSTSAPDNQPEAAGQKAFASGADGATPTRTNYQDALETFDPINSPLLINNADAAYAFASGGSVNDRAAAVLLQGDVAGYAETRGDAFAIVDVPAGLTATEAITYAADVKAAFAAAGDGGNTATYYPWIAVPDQLSAATAATRILPPGPAAMGKYLETDATRGVFKSPAGFGTRVSNAVALERSLTNTELDALNVAAAPVNAIRNVPGAGIVLMGARTLNNTPGERYINVRRSMIFLKKELTDRSAFAVFENNSERLWNQIRTSLTNFLRDYWSQGGLRGANPSQAFYVKCDASNNSPAQILSGRVNIEIGVAVEYPAEFIVISIGQITGSASA
jgi:phage tail sheath protein FI